MKEVTLIVQKKRGGLSLLGDSTPTFSIKRPGRENYLYHRQGTARDTLQKNCEGTVLYGEDPIVKEKEGEGCQYRTMPQNARREPDEYREVLRAARE